MTPIATPTVVSSYQLRDYQQNAVNEVMEATKTHNRVLVFAPTGAGKTVLATEIVRLFYNQGHKILIVVPRTTLIDQTVEKLKQLRYSAGQPISYSYIKAGYHYHPKARVYVASIQTWTRRQAKLQHQFGLIIVDECHYATAESYDSLFESNSMIVGLTATPFNLNKNRPLNQRFNYCVATTQTAELISLGYLTPLRIFAYPKDALLRKRLLENPNLIATSDMENISKTYHTYKEKCDGKKFIAFARSVHHSQQLCEYFNSQGVKTVHIEAKTPDSIRKRIFAEFRNGTITGIVSVGVLCEGFDEPSVEVCIMARPTLSRSLYLQQIGRVLRISPGKKTAILIDLAGNVWQHGMPFEPINPKATLSDLIPINQDADLRVCSNCGYVHENTTIRFCLECGYDMATEPPKTHSQRGKKAKVKVKEDVVELHEQVAVVDRSLASTPEKMIDNLILVCMQRNYRKAWVLYQLRSIYGNVDEKLGAMVCQKLNYKPHWWRMVLRQ